MENSQCRVYGGGSSVVANGNTLTVTLRLEFFGSFGGTKEKYTRVEDVSGAGVPWSISQGTYSIPTGPPVDVTIQPSVVTLYENQSVTFYPAVVSAANTGVTWTVSDPTSYGGFFTTSQSSSTYTASNPINAVREVVITASSSQDPSKSAVALITLSPSPAPEDPSVTPVNGSGAVQEFNFAVRHPQGSAGIGWIQTVFSATNPLQNGAPQGCMLIYAVGSNQLTLYSATTPWEVAGSSPVGQGGSTLQHGHCKVNAANSTFQNLPGQVILRLEVEFLPASSGTRYIYVSASNKQDDLLGWTFLGDWTVP